MARDQRRQAAIVYSRRAFVAAAGGLVVLPLGLLVAEAQETRIYRVGVLTQDSPPAPGSKPGVLRMALQRLGYIEGRNIVFQIRGAEGENARFPTLAAELVALKPDVIVADSTPAAVAAKHATTAIPVVIVNVSDPVGTGLVASLAHPGGNVTGGTDFGTELAVRSVGLLHDLVPKLSRIAVLMSDNPVHPLQLKAIEDASRNIRLTVLPIMVRTEADFEEAYASMVRQKAGALIWLGGSPVSTPAQRAKIIDLSAKAKLPTLWPTRRDVEAGGLMSNAANYERKWETVAMYIDKILKGAKPADLPIEQPTKFELVINLKTAKALGLTIPQSLLLRADEVVQ